MLVGDRAGSVQRLEVEICAVLEKDKNSVCLGELIKWVRAWILDISVLCHCALFCVLGRQVIEG